MKQLLSEQLSFDFSKLVSENVSETNKVYSYILDIKDKNEVNLDGIKKQKKDISDFLVKSNIPKHYQRYVHLKGQFHYGGKKMYDIMYYEGFYIEGYKIKYTHSKVYCYEYHADYQASDMYITGKLKEIYMLLKDKFDVMPVFVNNEISHLEITKDKQTIKKELDIVKNLENKIEEYVLEVRYKDDIYFLNYHNWREARDYTKLRKIGYN